MAYFSPIQSIPSTQIIRLTQDHEIKPFNCGRNDLNDFLFKDSLFNQNYLLLVTYILEIPTKTIAYFSVANDLLKINVDDCRQFKNILRRRIRNSKLYELFQRNAFPAVKIGRLAVDIEYQRLGIGTELLNAIKYSFITNNKTGCTFITVDSINDNMPINFYSKNNFLFLSERDHNDESRLMYYCLI
jgi:ribosomal protein S18 acetylase RimI-like enzyme